MTPVTPRGYVGDMKQSSLWPAVALVAVVVAGVVALSMAHVDLSTLVSLIPILVVPLLGVLVGKVSNVERQTNGNTSSLLDQVDALRKDNARLAELLARTGPALPPVDPDATQVLPVRGVASSVRGRHKR